MAKEVQDQVKVDLEVVLPVMVRKVVRTAAVAQEQQLYSVLPIEVVMELLL